MRRTHMIVVECKLSEASATELENHGTHDDGSARTRVDPVDSLAHLHPRDFGFSFACAGGTFSTRKWPPCDFFLRYDRPSSLVALGVKKSTLVLGDCRRSCGPPHAVNLVGSLDQRVDSGGGCNALLLGGFAVNFENSQPGREALRFLTPVSLRPGTTWEVSP
jgi:hypothetical protein